MGFELDFKRFIEASSEIVLDEVNTESYDKFFTPGPICAAIDKIRLDNNIWVVEENEGGIK